MFCSVAATWTPTRGSSYAPSSFSCVRNFPSTRQYCSGSWPRAGVFGGSAPALVSAGTLLTMSQLSRDSRPPDTPPWTTPRGSRAFIVTSMPFQCCVCRPNDFAAVT
jgi:hypothetical protein